MSTSSNSIFSGTSRYSNDFQQIIDRAVAIASLPKTQMENVKSNLSSQSSALSAVDARFTSLQSAIAGLASATESYNSSVSDGTVARASVSTTAREGTYQIEVVDIGSYTTAMSQDGLPQVTDPSSQNLSISATYTLTVDGVEYDVSPGQNTLSELARSINASGAPVQATVVNLGSSSAPDYRLSLQSTKLGDVSMQLNDGSSDLIGVLSAGTLATYRVNGQPSQPVSSDSRTVTVSPGLSVTMLKAGTTQITVSHNTAAVSTALSAFASAYNAAVDELDKHRGKDAGALEGSSLLYTLAQSLRDLAGYDSGSGGIASLTALGLIYDDKGKLSLDMTAFSQATDGQFQALAGFLGGTSTDGFLKYATDLMNGLEDSTDGVIKTAISSLNSQITWQDNRISEEQDRIDVLQQNLIQRMSVADAMIAQLETQVTYFTNLFQAMQDYKRNA
jgi:flagellar hook-associated protein 2